MRTIALDLRDALSARLTGHLSRGGEHAELLARFVADLAAIPDALAFRPSHAAPVRGLSFLAPALAEGNRGEPDPLLAAARTAAGWADWSEYYAPDAWSRPFVDRFANGDVIGPMATWHHEHLYVGLFLFGPHMTYPLHAHAAEEVYLVLCGSARFRVGADAAVIARTAGELSVHPSNCPHEIHTGAAPAFGVYAWRGDIASPTWYSAPTADQDESIQYPRVIGRA